MAVEEPATTPVAVKIYTSNNLVTGYVHVHSVGYRKRVSDLLNQEGLDFLPVTEARLYSHDGGVPLATEECVILNKHIIHSVIPLGENEGESQRPV